MTKRNLTKQKICDAAIQLIEIDGLDGLSMRKLASALNVEAPSLYNHIANKSALFDLVQEHLYSQIPTTFSDPNWKNHLSNLAISIRSGLLQIPKIILLFATRATVTTTSLKQAEITLNVLIKAGFKPSTVLLIYTNLHVFVIGHVLAEVGEAPGEADNRNELYLDKINIDGYHALKKAYSYASNVNFEKGFKLGLRCMINGLEKLLCE